MLTHIEELSNGQWAVADSITKHLVSIHDDIQQAQRESDYLNQITK